MATRDQTLFSINRIALAAVAVMLAQFLILDPASARSEQQLPQKNIGEYAAFNQIRVAQRMVQFCNSTAPELTVDLESAYADLVNRAMIAIKPALERIPRSKVLSLSVPYSLISATRDMEIAVLESIKDEKPKTVCAQALISMRSRTSEELRQRSEEAMRKFETLSDKQLKMLLQAQ